MSLFVRSREGLWVLGIAFLVFFAQTRGFHLLFDGLTYAALARNILRSGDWIHLHYGIEQYPDFFQHPPLAIWIQALVYKIFGFSEPISRFIPSLLALASAWVVFTIARVRAGLSAGVFSALVLITSTRFVKWATNFYLDGILTFFGFLGAALVFFSLTREADSSGKRSSILIFFGGVCMSLAFMVKGIAFLPMLGACGAMFLFFGRVHSLLRVGWFVLGGLIPLLLWGAFADGWAFIGKYFEVSASGRTDFHQISLHPWRNLYLLWLPWFPLFCLSMVLSVRGVFKGERLAKELLVWGVSALMVPVAYGFGAVYLEHYLTPFYPFASIVVGIQLGRWIPEIGDRGMRWLKAVFVGLAATLATVAPDVNFQQPKPADLWIDQVRSLSPDAQGRVRQIAFTDKAGELWLNLAVLLGRGDHQAIGSFDPGREPIPGTILVTRADESPKEESWVPVTCLFLREFRFYSSRHEKYCD